MVRIEPVTSNVLATDFSKGEMPLGSLELKIAFNEEDVFQLEVAKKETKTVVNAPYLFIAEEPRHILLNHVSIFLFLIIFFLKKT